MSDQSGLIVPDLSKISYTQYLKVQQLLNLQHPLSSPAEHDELLFIIIHQAYELWFKQILHEVEFAAARLREGKLAHFNRALSRVATIQDVLIQQVSILETMTPTDFNRFRDNLNPASGFQSHQFRLLEFRMGAKDARFLKFFESNQEIHTHLQKVIQQPSVWDEFLAYLSKRGFAIPNNVLQRDVAQPYVRDDGVLKVIEQIYNDQEKHYDLYVSLEKMIDVDERILLWRQRHVTMVERMIGSRRGTGGSSGVKYLSKTLEIRFFPEIWEVRSLLGAGYGS